MRVWWLEGEVFGRRVLGFRGFVASELKSLRAYEVRRPESMV